MKGRLKIGNILITLLILAGIIYGSIKYFTYKNSDEYKLKEIGYSSEEIFLLQDNLLDSEIDVILEKEYSNVLTDLIVEKYFMFKNLDLYLDYYKSNITKGLDSIVATINTKTNLDFYTDIKETDTSKGYLALLNKYNKLNEEYVPTDLVNMSLQYAYSNHRIREEVYEKYIEMCTDAKNEMGYKLIAISSYRTYELQEGLYNKYKNERGQEYADSISARPGHSEHQIGLALDIISYNSTMGSFENTDEYLWLKDNSYKYGFIVRYPEDKESLTGYDFEPWHYRYIGIDAATYIYENDITFDEYYAYFVE